jgi:hypothetical protein
LDLDTEIGQVGQYVVAANGIAYTDSKGPLMKAIPVALFVMLFANETCRADGCPKTAAMAQCVKEYICDSVLNTACIMLIDPGGQTTRTAKTYCEFKCSAGPELFAKQYGPKDTPPNQKGDGSDITH